MNDLHEENDVREYESERDRPACGLLPREHYRPDATLAVLNGVEKRAIDRLYRAVPVRIDGTETTLLAGTWCEFEERTAYRVTKPGGDRIRRERRLVTVELVEI